MGKRINKNQLKRIAKGRISRLLYLAKDSIISDSSNTENVIFANTCAKHIRELALKHQISLAGENRRLICRKCGSFLFVGVTCKVRTRKGVLIYHCNKCRNFNKFCYNK